MLDELCKVRFVRFRFQGQGGRGRLSTAVPKMAPHKPLASQ